MAPAATIIRSTFDTGTEGWQVVGDAQAGSVLPTWIATGGNPGGFITADDDVAGGVWYWQAPPHFLGNRAVAYQTNLTFGLRQSATDSQFDSPDVILSGAGITLTMDTQTNPGTDWTAFSVALDETAGWLVEATGEPPSASAMQAVLGDLRSLWIRGEFRDGDDMGSLDTVQLDGLQVTSRIFAPLVVR